MVNENLEALKAIFPEAFTEDGVEFEVLRQLLGDVTPLGLHALCSMRSASYAMRYACPVKFTLVTAQRISLGRHALCAMRSAICLLPSACPVEFTSVTA